MITKSIGFNEVESLLDTKEKDRLIKLLAMMVDISLSHYDGQITIKQWLDTLSTSSDYHEIKYLLGKHKQIKILEQREAL